MIIRQATQDDVDALVDIGRVMHAESSFAPMDYDPAVCSKTFLGLIKSGQFAVVVEHEGQIIGGMLGIITPSWFGKDWVANDIALFMLPSHRRGSAAVRMVDTFIAWGKAAGVKQIRPGVSTGCEVAERIYEAKGFARCGAIFYMNCKGESDEHFKA